MAKSKRYDLIVFDWDGTLIDSTALIVNALQSACRDLALEVPDRASAAHVIGLSLVRAVEVLAPGLDAAGRDAFIGRYRYHFLARDSELVLFEGARELLAWLRAEGYLVAVATGKARAGLDRALANTGLGPLFHTTRCADESFSKPHPGMLLEIFDELGVEPGRTLMIGDTTHDLLMARNAGAAAVAMGYGAHSLEVLEAEAPLGMLHSMAELHAWIAANG